LGDLALAPRPLLPASPGGHIYLRLPVNAI
jgi:hypothetical protein